MRISQKKSCEIGRDRCCRALGYNGRYICNLGFKILQDWDRKLFINRNPRPGESCPKPYTNADYYAASAPGEKKEPK
jgi:hypothetical protein